MALVTDTHAGEEGFTLVELLIAITISLVVLLATLQSFDVFTSNAAQQTRSTDANDQVRRTMERVVNDLRGASTIVEAAPTELVYRVPDKLGHRTERLCLDANYLYGSLSVTATVPAAAPTALCSTGTRLATLKSTSTTAFTYDGAASSTTPKLVKNVGLTFSLDASGGGRTASSTLRVERRPALGHRSADHRGRPHSEVHDARHVPQPERRSPERRRDERHVHDRRRHRDRDARDGRRRDPRRHHEARGHHYRRRRLTKVIRKEVECSGT